MGKSFGEDGVLSLLLYFITLPLNKYITSSVGKVQFSDKEKLVRYCVKKRTEKISLYHTDIGNGL